MKLDFNKKYNTIAVYSFIVICCSLVFYNILTNINDVKNGLNILTSTLQPFVIGFIIAYILNFILVFIEEKVLSKNIKKEKSKRAVSIISTYVIATFILYLFVLFVLPQLVDSISGLVNDVPSYINNATIMIEEVSKNIDIDEQYVDLVLEKWKEFINLTASIISNLLPLIGALVKTIASSIWNIILGIIISVYMLIEKEKFIGLGKKIFYAILSKKNAEIVINLGRRTNDTFGKFLSGKIIDSAIIGVLTFVILTIVKMPYTLLVSVIVGITNIIPFFGPFIGAFPAFIIIMFASPVKALWFLVIILIIQQLDGNVIGPKILGDSIGISAFWILFSILVAGKLLGLVGMIIGVPLFAVLYSVIKDIAEIRLKEKGLPTETKDYM